MERIEVEVKLLDLRQIEEWDMVERWLEFIRANELSKLGKAEEFVR